MRYKKNESLLLLPVRERVTEGRMRGERLNFFTPSGAQGASALKE